MIQFSNCQGCNKNRSEGNKNEGKKNAKIPKACKLTHSKPLFENAAIRKLLDGLPYATISSSNLSAKQIKKVVV